MTDKATKEEKVVVVGKVPLSVREAINELAQEEDRTFSNMVARLLEESPRLRERISELQAA